MEDFWELDIFGRLFFTLSGYIPGLPRHGQPLKRVKLWISRFARVYHLFF
jgi:peptidoglycan/LPS O-acetylase OafA/YrhL